MGIKFHATDFSATEEEWGYLTVLSAPSTEEEDFYLMLQRPYAFTAQDVALDQAQPYIEICDQGWSWYGNIASFQLTRKQITVHMSSLAASEMQSDGIIEVTYDLSEEDLGRLVSFLVATFDGFPYFKNRAT